jgi:RNA polymerase subunit RPABC4/transcription elongation factor Spt4
MDNSTVAAFVAGFVTNASRILEYFSYFAFILFICFWFYSGFYIYLDAKKRYAFGNSNYFYLILIFGLITGVIGLIIYSVIRPRYTFDEIEFMQTEYKYYFSNSSKVTDCLNCGLFVEEGALYCTNCGFQNRFKCKRCGAITDHSDNYCKSCGLDLQERNMKLYESVLVKSTAKVDKKHKQNQENKQDKKSQSESNSKQIQLFSAKKYFTKLKTTFSNSLEKIKTHTRSEQKP